MKLRPILFWTHLTAGVVAGVVILIMSVTGTLLAFQQSVLKMIEGPQRFVEVPAGAARLDVDTLLARVRAGDAGCRADDADARFRSARDGGGGARTARHGVRQSLHGRGARVRVSSRASLLPIGDQLAPLPVGRGRQSCDRPGDYRRMQCRVSRPRRQRADSVVAETVDRAVRDAGDLLSPRTARQGARLQLAQRHRILVRSGTHRAHRDRNGHLVLVGEQSRLHADGSPRPVVAGRGGGPGGGAAEEGGGRGGRGGRGGGRGSAEARARECAAAVS